MSMRNWPEYGIGLVLTTENRIGEMDEIDYLMEKMDAEDPYELVESQENSDHVWRYYDNGFDGKSFHPFAKNASSEEPEEMLVIWAAKGFDPFRAAYSGPEEIRKEFQDVIGKYMPEDFDWDAHIGEFSCCIFC